MVDDIFAIKPDRFKVRLETFPSLESKKRKLGQEDWKNCVVKLAVDWCIYWKDSSQEDVILDLFLYPDLFTVNRQKESLSPHPTFFFFFKTVATVKATFKQKLIMLVRCINSG